MEITAGSGINLYQTNALRNTSTPLAGQGGDIGADTVEISQQAKTLPTRPRL